MPGLRSIAENLMGLGTPAALALYEEQAFGPEWNVIAFGAKPDNGETDNFRIIQSIIDSMSDGDTLYFPEGRYAVSDTLIFRNIQASTIRMDGQVIPYGDFDDYLFQVDYTPGDSRGPALTTLTGNIWYLRFDCLNQSRGVCFRGLDFTELHLEVLYAYGNAFFAETMRESSIIMPKFAEGRHRDRFASPSNWDSGTSYLVGDRARRSYAAWAGGSTYAVNDRVLGSDSNFYSSIVASNMGNDPISSPTQWVRVFPQDYECVIANSNKDPLTFNTNSVTSGDRFWKRIYQAEGVMEFNDDGVIGDASNNVQIFSPIFIGNDNKVFLLVDNQKQQFYARRIKIWGGMLHYLEAVLNVHQQVYDGVHLIEVMRADDIFIQYCNLRLGLVTERSTLIYIGDNSKECTGVKVDGNTFSGEGDGQMGIRVENLPAGGNNSHLSSSYLLTGSGSQTIVDPGGPLLVQNVYSRTIIRSLYGAPLDLFSPSGVRTLGHFRNGETQPRMLSLDGALWFGVGGSTAVDTAISRAATGRLTIGATGAVTGNIQLTASATAAQMQDITHAINTVGKWAGKIVYVSDATKLVYTVGSTAGSVWNNMDGTLAYTPV